MPESVGFLEGRGVSWVVLPFIESTVLVRQVYNCNPSS